MVPQLLFCKHQAQVETVLFLVDAVGHPGPIHAAISHV